MKKRLVAGRELDKNHTIAKSDLSLKRIHYAKPEITEDEVIGRVTKTSIKQDTPFTSENVEIKKNKVVAAIACRIESTRLFAKPLKKVDEKTILDYIIIQLKQCKNVDEIVLAISQNKGNEIFVEFARKNHLKFVRGDDEDVLERVISAADLVNANIVLRVTSEDPFKYWQVIDDAIRQHITNKVDFTSCVDDLPEGSGFEIISLDALKQSHQRGERRNKSELVTSYIREHPAEFSIMSFDIPQKLKRSDVRLTVDYPEDLILVRDTASKFLRDGKLPELEKIIAAIDADPILNELHKDAITRSKKTAGQ
jgi:spore coat polysaccharide biosynthesis protein SpsF